MFRLIKTSIWYRYKIMFVGYCRYLIFLLSWKAQFNLIGQRELKSNDKHNTVASITNTYWIRDNTPHNMLRGKEGVQGIIGRLQSLSVILTPMKDKTCRGRDQRTFLCKRCFAISRAPPRMSRRITLTLYTAISFIRHVRENFLQQLFSTVLIKIEQNNCVNLNKKMKLSGFWNDA